MTGNSDGSSAAAARFAITSIAGAGCGGGGEREDLLAVEEPLEIWLFAETVGERRKHRLSVTMRSPGHDEELACGLLLAEGIIAGPNDVWRIARCADAGAESAENIIEVHLAPEVEFQPRRHRRLGYTSSSCGVCGKESIEQLRALGGRPVEDGVEISADDIRRLPQLLRSSQSVFARTGGLHACGVFSPSGEVDLVREDVGRHNALDKVTGRLLLDDRLPASASVLLLSGRASFELVHKAMAAGISTVLAVGAPSSLAVETAEAFGMTLAGFVREGRFNIYSGGHRIRL